MNDERMRILEMVRDGKITAEEGVRLLEALQPKAATGTGSGAPDGREDPFGKLASAISHAMQSGDWKNLVGQLGGAWSTGPLGGLERRHEREAEGWEFLTLSDGDQGTFDLPAGSEVAVEHEAGSVEATAVDGLGRIELEGEGLHNYGVYAARKEGKVVIACHRTAPFARMPRLKVSVPRAATAVSLKTAGGSLTAEAFAVPLTLKTAGGSVRVRDQQQAPVTAKTAGGGIKVNGTPARLDLHTSGGSIRFDGTTEAFDVKTSGGSVHIEGARLASGEHSAKTNGGSVRIGLAPEASVEIEAKTSAGSLTVDLPGVEGERSGSRVSPRYHGRYNGGAARLHVSTAAGSVTIGLAEAAGATEQRQEEAA